MTGHCWAILTPSSSSAAIDQREEASCHPMDLPVRTSTPPRARVRARPPCPPPGASFVAAGSQPCLARHLPDRADLRATRPTRRRGHGGAEPLAKLREPPSLGGIEDSPLVRYSFTATSRPRLCRMPATICEVSWSVHEVVLVIRAYFSDMQRALARTGRALIFRSGVV